MSIHQPIDQGSSHCLANLSMAHCLHALNLSLHFVFQNSLGVLWYELRICLFSFLYLKWLQKGFVGLFLQVVMGLHDAIDGFRLNSPELFWLICDVLSEDSLSLHSLPKAVSLAAGLQQLIFLLNELWYTRRLESWNRPFEFIVNGWIIWWYYDLKSSKCHEHSAELSDWCSI